MQPKEISEVIFHLRDINQAMTNAWEKEFAPYSDTVKVYLSSHSLKMPYVKKMIIIHSIIEIFHYFCF